MRRFLSLASAALLAASPVMAGGAGSTGAPFLKVPINGRAVGMAGAFTSVNGDLTSMEYNPAGLSGLPRVDIGLTYIDYVQDTSFQSAGIATPIGRAAPGDNRDRRPVIGFQFRQFSADDDARSELGVKTGSINIRDQLFHLALSLPLADTLALGAAGKYVSRTLESESTSGFSGDAGLLWHAPRQFTLGASVLNAGPATAFISEKDPTPLLVRIGASRPFGPALVAADVTRGRDSVTRLAGGAEFRLGRFVRLRGGAFQQTGDLGFSAGLGVMLPGPLKSPPSARRRGSVPPLTAAAMAPTADFVFNERRAADLLDRLNALSADLTDRFHRSGRRPADHPLVVLPAIGAGGRMGTALADLLSQQLQQEFPVVEGARVEATMQKAGVTDDIDDDQAARLGRALGARAVVVQQFTSSRDGHSLHDRIILVDSGDAVAAASTSFPTDVFRGGRPSLAPAPPAPAEPRTDGGFDRVDWGLDYGLTTRDDLGVSHTLTLKILY